MSSPPKARSAARTIAPMSARRETSPNVCAACPPSLVIFATTCSPSAALRAETTTFAPSAAKASAIARPMPRPAPVTSATWSAKRGMAHSLRQKSRHASRGNPARQTVDAAARMTAGAAQKKPREGQGIPAQASGGAQQSGPCRRGINMDDAAIEDVEAFRQVGRSLNAPGNLVSLDTLHVFVGPVDKLRGYALTDGVPTVARIDRHRNGVEIRNILARRGLAGGSRAGRGNPQVGELRHITARGAAKIFDDRFSGTDQQDTFTQAQAVETASFVACDGDRRAECNVNFQGRGAVGVGRGERPLGQDGPIQSAGGDQRQR